METKNKVYKNLAEIKSDINQLAAKADRTGSELRALVKTVLGDMPTNPLELTEFIETILELKKHDD